MPLFVRVLWITCAPAEAGEALRGHRAQVDDLERRGRLRAAGSFPDDEGLLEIFEAGDRMEAEAVARASPLVELGLATWFLRRWDERAPG